MITAFTFAERWGKEEKDIFVVKKNKKNFIEFAGRKM